MKPCNCGREINPLALKASIFEEQYCSEYCRVFQTNNLSILNGEIDLGNSQLRGFNWWPIIEIPCEMCEKPTELRYEWEAADKQFCSRLCYTKMKTARPRKSQMNYAMLRLLRHRRRHYGEGWVSAGVIHEIMSRRRDVIGNPRRWGGLLQRWVKRGVVEIQRGTPNQYRLHLDHITGPLAQMFHEYENR